MQGLPNFFGYPLLSQEWQKLRISNLASTFRGSIGTKVHSKIWRKRSVGVSRPQGLPKFFGYPYYLRNGKSYRFQNWPLIIWEATTSRTTVSNCPVLSNLCTVITLNFFFWGGQDFGGLCAPGPNLETPLHIIQL